MKSKVTKVHVLRMTREELADLALILALAMTNIPVERLRPVAKKLFERIINGEAK